MGDIPRMVTDNTRTVSITLGTWRNIRYIDEMLMTTTLLYANLETQNECWCAYEVQRQRITPIMHISLRCTPDCRKRNGNGIDQIEVPVSIITIAGAGYNFANASLGSCFKTTIVGQGQILKVTF